MTGSMHVEELARGPTARLDDVFDALPGTSKSNLRVAPRAKSKQVSKVFECCRQHAGFEGQMMTAGV